ncbi:hypothetical protein OIV83_003279 [Microbotryomycetes sp. JL201]|nr:hypothetical protein OIV83_003279 [Microbotryomycetes sp. JL201]
MDNVKTTHDTFWQITLVKPSASVKPFAQDPTEPGPIQTRDQDTRATVAEYGSAEENKDEDEDVDTSNRIPNALDLYPTLDNFTSKLAEIDVSEVITHITHLTTRDDIHETTGVRSQASLQEALQETRNALSHAEMLRLLDTLAPMTFVTDGKGQLLWLSEQYYLYTGCGPQCTSVEFVANYFEGDLHRVLPIYMGGVARGEPYKFEYRLRRADASYQWFLCEGNPIRNADGDVFMYAGSITNVDELVKSRHDALSVRAHVRAALTGANIVMLSVDLDDRIQFYEGDLDMLWSIQHSHENLPTSERPPIIVGKTLLDELWPDERVKETISRALEEPDQFFAKMFDYKDVSGSTKYSRYRIGATRGGLDKEDHEITGVVIVAGDVTAQINADVLLKKTVQDHEQLRQSELAAQEASRLKTTFLQLLSHEIRSPIAGMIGICELLLEDASLSEAHRSLVSKCLRLGEIQLELVNAVLDLRKLEQNEMTIESESFELEQLIADARLYSLAAQQKGLTYTDVMEEGIYEATLLGDRLRLRQVLANALSNAIKFTQKGGVTFKVRQTGETSDSVVILFSVEDTGEGIPENVLPKLFQPFKQADASTARTHGGTGLGLAIAKSLVELMNGKVDLKSVEGKGTTFTAEIPLRKAPFDHVGRTAYGPKVELGIVNGSSVDHGGRAAKDVKVLLAEDNEVLRTIVTKLLHKMGFAVWTAKDGSDAIEAARRQTFDVVLMDCMMPGVDGYEATRAIRKMGKPTKIIALTANAVLGDEQRCLEAGMHAYMSKPVRAKHLEETIWRVLQEGIAAPGDATAPGPVTQVQGSDQIVPVSTGSASTSTANSDFPVAAIALVSIVAGVVFLVVLYKLYRWYYRREQSPLPEARLPTMTSTGTLIGGFDRHSRSMSAIGLLSAAAGTASRQRQESWAGESSLNEKDWSPTASPGTLSPPPGALTFDSGSNGSNGSLSAMAGAMNTAASRNSLASSSYGAPRRSFYGNNAQVGSGPFLRSMPSSSRLNGAPHNPHSRIDIRPPAPLAPPPGTVIAKTKSSLDFAPSSGITPIENGQGELSPLQSALANVGDGSTRYISSSQAAHENQRRLKKLHTSRTNLSSASSSLDPSPTASSSGLRSAYQAQAPLPVDTALANSSHASFAHVDPTSPLERLQQQIVQQQARMSGSHVTDDGVSSMVIADEQSVGSSSLDASSDEGYRAPGQVLADRLSPKA